MIRPVVPDGGVPIGELNGRHVTGKSRPWACTQWLLSIPSGTLVGTRVRSCGALHVSDLVAGEGGVHANAARKMSMVRSTPRLVISCRANNRAICPPKGSEGLAERSVIQTRGGQSPREPGTPVPCRHRSTSPLSPQPYERRSNPSGSDPKRPCVP